MISASIQPMRLHISWMILGFLELVELCVSASVSIVLLPVQGSRSSIGSSCSPSSERFSSVESESESRSALLSESQTSSSLGSSERMSNLSASSPSISFSGVEGCSSSVSRLPFSV